MARPRLILPLLLVCAAVVAAAARPLSACSILGPTVVRTPSQTLLMVVPRADSVYVGRAGRLDGVRLRDWLRPRDFARKSGAWQRVYGQRVRVVRAAWNLGWGFGDRLRDGGSEAVVVPWGLGSDCGSEAWRHSALSMRPGGRAVLTAVLRPRPGWIGGVPTFDAPRIAREPYPVDPAWSWIAGHEKARGRWLNLEEYWSMAAAFPVAGRNGVDFRSFDRWEARNPALARLFPAPTFLRAARDHRLREAELRRAGHRP
jgi:hypothetical protein